MIATEIEYTF